MACEAKVAWPSRRLAARARKNQIGMADFNSKDRKRLNVYKCPVCAQWHVGTEDVVRLRSARKAKLEHETRRGNALEDRCDGG